ncbi:MAG: aminoacyl-tRNA hydrolase [Ignavibacteriaceae bacterium]
MKCILGIGNPGSQYINTRHNVGFQLLDNFASANYLKFIPSKFDFYFSEGELDKIPYVLIKPTTYVNNSGLAAKQCLDLYNIGIEDLLIVVDDVNLQFGDLRLRKSGGDGGHNGLRSIIYHLNSEDFSRLRFGIGGEFDKSKLSGYVLSPFSKEELAVIGDLLELVTSLLETFIKDGYQAMLSGYSRIKKKEIQNDKTNDENE